MDENSGHVVEDRASSPTYKSLFLAACAIIGSAFGWWFTNFIADYTALTSRVAELEVRDTETKWTFRINGEKLKDCAAHEDRLRALERAFDHNNRPLGGK